MSTPILNRDFSHPEDGWYHVEPIGEHRNAAAGVVQVIDREACETIVANFNRIADAEHFPGMLVDHEHFRHDADKETRAFGWLMKLQNRDDGLYGQIRWTTTGKNAVDGGDYRFFSTEYLPSEAVLLNDANGARRIRPTRLHGLTLTNQPNNHGGKPITNRAPDDPVPKVMTNIAKALGLPETASEADILAAITALQEAKAAMKGKNEAIANRLLAAEAELLKNREAQADADLAPVADKLSQEDRDAIRAQLIANRAAALPLLRLAVAAATPPPPATPPKPGGPVLNRDAAKTPQVEDFPAIVNRHVKAGAKREAAVRAAIAENPEAYADWRKTGGKL